MNELVGEFLIDRRDAEVEKYLNVIIIRGCPFLFDDHHSTAVV